MRSSSTANWPRPIAAGLRAALRLLPVCLLVSCAHNGYSSAYYGPVPYDGTDPAALGRHAFAPTHYYPPPGSPEDPWGPYIREAAAQYRVPEQWVRAVMHQESGGREQAVSPVGAMGLMQVMPATYEGLRQRHGLGSDPYDPHNNILAGTAYIREMYDRYGAPGFLAAYNAGPDRVDSYLSGASPLPDETVNYLASITPNLGSAVPLSGPLAMYASAESGRYAGVAPTVASQASGCDVNAAYDPGRPCTPLEQDAATPVQVASYQPVSGGCDPNAAYDPDRPCTPEPATAPVQMASAGGCDPDAAYDPSRPCQALPVPQPPPASMVTTSAIYQPSMPPPRSFAPPPPPPPRTRQVLAFAPAPMPIPTAGGAWAIQVGAFANQGLARAVAEGARAEAPEDLRTAAVALPATTPFGGSVLYRARLVHLSAREASGACTHLNQRQLPCVVVQPTGS
jgi:D-alanyl-D-alanine carboxypeptidase